MSSCSASGGGALGCCAGAGAGAAGCVGATISRGSLEKSRAASLAASLLPYIGLFGSAIWPAVGSADLPALPPDLSVKGEAPLVIIRATTTAMPRPTTRPMMMPTRVLPCWRRAGEKREAQREAEAAWFIGG